MACLRASRLLRRYICGKSKKQLKTPIKSRGTTSVSCNHKSATAYQEIQEEMTMPRIEAWLALGVFLLTAATDAVYVLFNAGCRWVAAYISMTLLRRPK